MDDQDYGTIEISAELKNETAKALQLFDGERAAWVPRSQVTWTGKNLWTMPEWLAKNKGFI
jgi:hypothetical protein